MEACERKLGWPSTLRSPVSIYKEMEVDQEEYQTSTSGFWPLHVHTALTHAQMHVFTYTYTHIQEHYAHAPKI